MPHTPSGPFRSQEKGRGAEPDGVKNEVSKVLIRHRNSEIAARLRRDYHKEAGRIFTPF